MVSSLKKKKKKYFGLFFFQYLSSLNDLTLTGKWMFLEADAFSNKYPEDSVHLVKHAGALQQIKTRA